MIYFPREDKTTLLVFIFSAIVMIFIYFAVPVLTIIIPIIAILVIPPEESEFLVIVYAVMPVMGFISLGYSIKNFKRIFRRFLRE